MKHRKLNFQQILLTGHGGHYKEKQQDSIR